MTFEFHEDFLIARVSGYYSEFYDYFCESRSNIEFSEICMRYDGFYKASIVYLTFTLICMIAVVLSLVHFFALGVKSNNKWVLRLWFVHYLYPFLHTLALVLFVWVSGLFELNPPVGFSSEFKVVSKAGMFLMIFAELVAVCSLFIYLFNGIEEEYEEDEEEESDFFDVFSQKNEESSDFDKKTQKQTYGNLKKLPVLPVSETFISQSSDSLDSKHSSKISEKDSSQVLEKDSSRSSNDI